MVRKSAPSPGDATRKQQMEHLKDGRREVWFCLGGLAVTGLLSGYPCRPGLTCTGRLSAQAPAARPHFHWVGHRGSAATNLEEAQVSTALLSAAPPPSTHIVPRHCPVAGSHPWPGVTCAEGCTWACWLIYPWPLAEGPPAQAATREERGEKPEPRQTGLAFGP